jgi:hypothetical protein
MSGGADRRRKSARAAAEPVESARERSVAMASSGASAAGSGEAALEEEEEEVVVEGASGEVDVEKGRSLERRRRPWRWWRESISAWRDRLPPLCLLSEQ